MLYFESGVVKIQDGKENLLTEIEKKAVEILKLTSYADSGDDLSQLFP